MDEIIAFLMKSILPALAGAGASFGLNQLLSPGGDNRGPSGGGEARPSFAGPGLEGLTGAGSSARPMVGSSFTGGSTGGAGADTNAVERPVSSGFTTLTPSPMGDINQAMSKPKKGPTGYV